MSASERTERFETEIVPHIEMLARVALLMTRNAHDAEDLVQETLLRAYKGIHTFDGRHPRAWLLTIMRNVLASRHSAKRVSLLPWSEVERPEPRAHTPASRLPEDRAVDSEFVDAIKRVARDLSDHHREVFVLVDLVGFSYEEAAEHLGIPVGTVMSRLHRARARVRRKLAILGLAPPTVEENGNG